MSEDNDSPEPDRLGLAPHPRKTWELYGQSEAEETFRDAYRSGRPHHAWLLMGPKGIGKATLAWRIARFLITHANSAASLSSANAPLSLEPIAGHPALRRIQALSEPTLCLVRRPWDDKTKRFKTHITVDEVRKLHSFFSLSAADGGPRVVIIDAADEMNTAAANALLKILEEPPARTTLLLVSHKPAALLPTLRSRCRSLTLSPLTADDLTAAVAAASGSQSLAPSILALANGSVGQALLLLEQGGGALYQELLGIYKTGRMNRSLALQLSESLTGATNRQRFELFLFVLESFFARVSRTGVLGPQHPQAGASEADLMGRLAPHDGAARAWAALASVQMERLRHGYGVNLDPTTLALDTLIAIDRHIQQP